MKRKSPSKPYHYYLYVGKSHSIQCCEQTNLMVSNAYCPWIDGSYGEFIECPAGFAMTGSCGSGKDEACDNNSATHRIRCCPVE